MADNTRIEWADATFNAWIGCNFKQVGGRGSDKGGHELDGRTYFDRPQVPHA